MPACPPAGSTQRLIRPPTHPPTPSQPPIPAPRGPCSHRALPHLPSRREELEAADLRGHTVQQAAVRLQLLRRPAAHCSQAGQATEEASSM